MVTRTTKLFEFDALYLGKKLITSIYYIGNKRDVYYKEEELVLIDGVTYVKDTLTYDENTKTYSINENSIKATTETVKIHDYKPIYSMFESVSNCFSAGYWNSLLAWTNDDAWTY